MGLQRTVLHLLSCLLLHHFRLRYRRTSSLSERISGLEVRLARRSAEVEALKAAVAMMAAANAAGAEADDPSPTQHLAPLSPARRHQHPAPRQDARQDAGQVHIRSFVFSLPLPALAVIVSDGCWRGGGPPCTRSQTL